MLVGDNNYGLLVDIAIVALAACLIVMFFPARALDRELG